MKFEFDDQVIDFPAREGDLVLMYDGESTGGWYAMWKIEVDDQRCSISHSDEVKLTELLGEMHYAIADYGFIAEHWSIPRIRELLGEIDLERTWLVHTKHNYEGVDSRTLSDLIVD